MGGDRKQKVVSLEKAISHIKDGCFLAIGGFMIHNHPMAIIREIIKQEIGGLKMLPTPPGGSIDADLPYGAHPCSSHWCYLYDEDHIREYVQCAKDPDRFQEYLGQYVHGVENPYEYLELIGGIRKICDLRMRQ